ncbi:MAG: sulfite exporter TauE/SafE family protein [Candidatus Krumholzibacteriia bacterium]
MRWRGILKASGTSSREQNVVFPVSGVETPLWVPPAVAFTISFFTSMGGLSGAFLLLPFQMSVLGFTSPAVTATNLLFNVVGIPAGVWGYVREGRMLWSLTWIIAAGSLPGVAVGGLVRLHWLPDPVAFKAFVGLVLLFIGGRLLADVLRWRRRAPRAVDPAAIPLHSRSSSAGGGGSRRDWDIQVTVRSRRRLAYRFRGDEYDCPPTVIFALSLVVGIVGGIYGVGGGALIGPFLVAVYGLPVHTIAGATLMATFVTSVAGVAFYQIAAQFGTTDGLAVAPDWALGALFGAGGLVGMYAGSRLQRYVPGRWLKVLLVIVLLWVAARYLVSFATARI